MSAIRWLRLGLVFAIFAATLGLFPSPAYACDCAEGPPIEEVADSIDLAFVGRQLSRSALDEPAAVGDYSSWDVELTFEVLDVYKGDISNPGLVYSEQSSCGVDFDGRGIDGVIAFDVDQTPTVRSCRWFRASPELLRSTFGAPHEPADTATNDGADADVVELDEGAVDVDEGASSWVLVLAPAVAIGCAGLALFLRARRSD